MFNSSFNIGKIIKDKDKIIKDKDKIFTGLVDNLSPNIDTNQEYDKNNIHRKASKALEKIELICNKFNKVSRQMRSRYNARPTLTINDEYDVQDLFHSLLTLYFNDIRKEEGISSYAGSNSRADFLLKQEQILIEIKKTRVGLTNKKLGDELIIDIDKYQAHPDCKTLVFFVYDPESRIDNPRQFERDLETRSRKIDVKVFIRPY